MFHPNIYADGGICLDILQNRWYVHFLSFFPTVSLIFSQLLATAGAKECY
jgi:ubiquitin-protein ligase